MPPRKLSHCPTPTPTRQWTLEQTARNVHTLRFDNVDIDWEQWILVRGDAHHDNIHCDQDFERQHLELALQRNAAIFDIGDLFCAMQGKYDPRSDMSDLRPEHKTTKYLDALVNTAAEFYRPYAGLFAFMGRGNHETNIERRHGIDLTEALARKMREAGGVCVPGGYGGWVRLLFIINKTVRFQLRIKYFHGSGGDAAVTRGMIQTNRQAVYLMNADVVINGHTHDSYIAPVQREYLNDAGRVEQRVCWFLRTPSYKDEYADGYGGYHVEGGRAPKPIGAIWCRLYQVGDKRHTIVPEFSLAVRP